MQQFTVYDITTGRILRTLDMSAEMARANVGDGEGLMPGSHDGSLGYSDGKAFIQFPDRPTAHHVWDYDTRKWTDPRSEADIVTAQRAERDQMLVASDWTQLPDAPLTDEKRHAWRNYRQALRDLPETGGAWPQKPE